MLILISSTLDKASNHIVASSPNQSYIIHTSFTITKYHMIHIVMHTHLHIINYDSHIDSCIWCVLNTTLYACGTKFLMSELCYWLISSPLWMLKHPITTSDAKTSYHHLGTYISYNSW